MAISYIQHKDYLRRLGEMKRIQSLGIELVYKKNLVKIIGGVILVGVGLITLPLPTGSIVMVALGCSLVTTGGIDIWGIKKGFLSKLRFKLWGLKR